MRRREPSKRSSFPTRQPKLPGSTSTKPTKVTMVPPVSPPSPYPPSKSKRRPPWDNSQAPPSKKTNAFGNTASPAEAHPAVNTPVARTASSASRSSPANTSSGSSAGVNILPSAGFQHTACINGAKGLSKTAAHKGRAGLTTAPSLAGVAGVAQGQNGGNRITQQVIRQHDSWQRAPSGAPRGPRSQELPRIQPSKQYMTHRTGQVSNGQAAVERQPTAIPGPSYPRHVNNSQPQTSIATPHQPARPGISQTPSISRSPLPTQQPSRSAMPAPQTPAPAHHQAQYATPTPLSTRQPVFPDSDEDLFGDDDDEIWAEVASIATHQPARPGISQTPSISHPPPPTHQPSRSAMPAPQTLAPARVHAQSATETPLSTPRPSFPYSDEDLFDDDDDDEIWAEVLQQESRYDPFDTTECFMTFQSVAVGIRHYDGIATVGEQLTFYRQPDNQYDKNCINIKNVEGATIGNIPREYAAKLAPLIDGRKMKLEGVVCGVKTQFELPIRFEMTVPARDPERAASIFAVRNAKIPKAVLSEEHKAIEKAKRNTAIMTKKQAEERVVAENRRQWQEAHDRKAQEAHRKLEEINRQKKSRINYTKRTFPFTEIDSDESDSDMDTELWEDENTMRFRNSGRKKGKERAGGQRGTGPSRGESIVSQSMGWVPNEPGLFPSPSQAGLAAGFGPTPQELIDASYNALLKSGTEVINPREVTQMVQKFGTSEEDLEKLPSAVQPTKLKTQLLPYQLQGLAWLLKREHPQLPLGDDVVQMWKASGNQQYTNVATNFSTGDPVLTSGGLLADDMGLGKTLQTISLIVADVDKEKELEFDKKVDTSECTAGTLILCPVSVMSNWTDQMAQHVAPEHELKVHRYHAAGKSEAKNLGKYDVVITSYGTLSSDFGQSKKKNLFSYKWRRVVLDEAHLIRNPKSKTTISAYNLDAVSRWALTGTPIVNSLKDLYSLICFLRYSGGLSDWDIFNRSLVRPLARGDPAASQMIQVLMATSCLRRVKDMKFVELGLPRITEMIQRIPFRTSEAAQYRLLELEAQGLLRRYTEKGGESYRFLLEILLRMRQVCNHTALCGARLESLRKLADIPQVTNLNPENVAALQDLLQIAVEASEECAICFERLHEPMITTCKHVFGGDCISKVIELQKKCPLCRCDLPDAGHLITATAQAAEEYEPVPDAKGGSSKTDAIINILLTTKAKHPGTKTVVFSQWSSFLTLLQPLLEAAGITFTVLTGSLTPAQRDRSIADFSNRAEDSPDVLLASLAVANVGLNLVAANQVILSDSWWAPAVEDQAIDRVHRLGQKKECTVWRLVIEGKMEENVLKIQARKRELVAEALGGGEVKRKKTREERVKEVGLLLGVVDENGKAIEGQQTAAQAIAGPATGGQTLGTTVETTVTTTSVVASSQATLLAPDPMHSFTTSQTLPAPDPMSISMTSAIEISDSDDDIPDPDEILHSFLGGSQDDDGSFQPLPDRMKKEPKKRRVLLTEAEKEAKRLTRNQKAREDRARERQRKREGEKKWKKGKDKYWDGGVPAAW
ncbi:Similar to Helicase-like transcription factor; acc. no. Q14527 [Pyronema omphalodes CBS 100304]|uniref:Similar to Helicase-like transcription factor acc. no. Q14527 n=1 Tax=Pyronema omphalodes (strain CBS 100304) TaxID=1076935 RepID=U4LBZ8_PYROM|nr:Similar to Helicase-like transcription factor; acc. no. Q14527 [Pyronema omphalodes CBS 100304]